jgi:serine protease
MHSKSFVPTLLLSAIALALSTGNVAAQQYISAQHPIKNSYIVVLKEEAANLRSEATAVKAGSLRSKANIPTLASVADAMTGQYQLGLRKTYNEVLRGFAVTASPATILRMLKDPRVAYIEENGEMHASTTQTGATWGLDRVDQRSLPLNGSYTYSTTASNVSAYVIDTGILASHNQFGGRVQAGFTAINDGYGTTDCAGHGTHVAGTIGGATYGMAKGVKLYPVRVLGCNGSGSTDGIIAGMDWVASNHRGPSVANMSLGGGASTATDQAVARLRNSGVVVAVAAGNENQNACDVSPARAAGAITVGATQSNDARSSFSNWGTCVDIFAPGTNITSSWGSGSTAINTISGTSMATPHVAGAVALYLSTHPNATPAQVEQALYANASPNKVSNAGAGSSNRLLYTQFADEGSPGTPDQPNPTGTTVAGYLQGTGYYADHPSPYQYVTAAGTISATLKGPSNADFELHLYRWNGTAWQIVAKSESPTSNEALTYSANPGYYTIEVFSYRGAGNYSLTYALPK